MKNSWLIWVFVVGIVLTILIAFNYQGAQDTVPLSEIFPETETYPLEIEYVDEQPVSEPPTIARTAPTVSQPVTQIVRTPSEPPSPPVPVAAKVVATPPKPAPAAVQTPAAAQTTAAKPYKYSIQVASFKDKDKAQQKVEELNKKDYQAFLVSKDIRDKGTWHRVYVGKFDSKSEADSYLPKVKKNYSSSFIIATK
ncbi:MAG: SPOR domain-containing protein [Candidatus Omnitrophica bacterium]|nr:SPOR domain-containing protein [Candidatus Omnitrophota bacterium]MCB9721203.1 SPOR domain-containing protein [Candidatus Omnitrophota bacterium]